MEGIDLDYMGPLLKSIRKKEKLTQDELAERLGITSRYVSAIENEGKCPALELWIRIIRTLHASADAIVYPEDAKTETEPFIRMFSLLNERDKEIVMDLIQSLLNHP